jgi:hypothetical protein
LQFSTFFFLHYFLQVFKCIVLTHATTHIINTKHKYVVKKLWMLGSSKVIWPSSNFFIKATYHFCIY